MSALPTPDEVPRQVPIPMAWMVAWAALAIVDAVFIARLSSVVWRVRLLHHLYDAGHLLFVGAATALLLVAWKRLAPRDTRIGWLALAVSGVGLAVWSLQEDFAGFASEAGGEGGGTWLLAVMLAVAGLTPVALAAVMVRLTRWSVVWAAVGALGALSVAVANNLFLRADYRGVHLFAAVDAAVVLTAALASIRLPQRIAQLGERRRLGLGALLGLGAVSAVSIALPPSNLVRVELGRVEGAILVPVLARAGWGARRHVVEVPADLAPWFQDRSHLSAIRPSKPSLLPPDPIVILLGIDSLRADLFAKPETRARMPNLTAVAERSVSFTRARSPGARTITTWSSVFTGRYSSGLRWRGDGNRLSIAGDPTRRFTELLADAGVHTTSFVSYSALGKDGLSRGMDEVVDVPAKGKQKFALSTDVVPLMIEMLDTPHAGPRFVFAHWMDPHFPYDAAGKRGSSFDRFLAEVQLADTSFGALWAALEQRGLLTRTVLVVTADHGEAFGQHGTPYHTVTVYEELVRVPLFIVAPGVAPRTIDQPVTLMDLGPTILDLFGQPTPASFLGESLVPFLRGETPSLTRPIASERSGTRGMVIDGRKVIVDTDRGRDEIYDLASDPEELDNLADDLGPEGDRLLGLVRAFFETHAVP